MAQPKRRWSKERTHLRRSTWKLENKNLSTCPNVVKQFYHIQHVLLVDITIKNK